MCAQNCTTFTYLLARMTISSGCTHLERSFREAHSYLLEWCNILLRLGHDPTREEQDDDLHSLSIGLDGSQEEMYYFWCCPI